jgi:hypothetical protein
MATEVSRTAASLEEELPASCVLAAVAPSGFSACVPEELLLHETTRATSGTRRGVMGIRIEE